MKRLGETIVVIVAYFRKLETLSVSFAACRLQTQEAGAKAAVRQCRDFKLHLGLIRNFLARLTSSCVSWPAN